jgi:hypothetical protein
MFQKTEDLNQLEQHTPLQNVLIGQLKNLTVLDNA